MKNEVNKGSKSLLLILINNLVASGLLPKCSDISVIMGIYVKSSNDVMTLLKYYGVSADDIKSGRLSTATLSVTDRHDAYLQDSSTYSTVSSLV